jgi:hypothetical protein
VSIQIEKFLFCMYLQNNGQRLIHIAALDESSISVPPICSKDLFPMLVLTHTLYIKNATREQAVDIRVYQPVQGDGFWRCRYEIDWPRKPKFRETEGISALQALMGALMLIGADIYSSHYHYEGRLRAYDKEEGYGFPVVPSLRDDLIGVDAFYK